MTSRAKLDRDLRSRIRHPDLQSQLHWRQQAKVLKTVRRVKRNVPRRFTRRPPITFSRSIFRNGRQWYLLWGRYIRRPTAV
ncbi:hypothetical protein EOD42_02990 [Rhodovarius crocodyli]|uniref:Uncharacterized protein n=1 Tax=Rhodovarius crocodyli TaxID=1979269 RepID=A0A437MN55_9PROT|nr:hypothetical protein [Rhodovarius crocodyli]RVT99088.1 hypothetical protein EOD42_02990 [Rhodovarius crocodyli]